MHISEEGRQASELGEGRLSRVLTQQRECLLRDRLGVCAQVLGLLLLGILSGCPESYRTEGNNCDQSEKHVAGYQAPADRMEHASAMRHPPREIR